MKSTSWLKIFIEKSVLCCALLFAGLATRAQQRPVAAFSGTALSGCAPILVNFTDLSAGTPNYWKWDLGNGTISYLQHPSVTYFTPGIYSVKLLVKNVAGEDSLIKTNYVQVYAAPVVNFSAGDTTACGSLSTSFVNQGTPGNAWQWDFGDGIFSTAADPSHTYTQTGTYNVSLKVINSDGCAASMVRPNYITVNAVHAGFTTNIPSRCEPRKISFQNSATGNGHLQFTWRFGDGDSSVTRDAVHTYRTGGSYTATLEVQNEFGCREIANKQISVENPVSADFSTNTPHPCKAPATVHFTTQALAGNNYYWYFGDSSLVSATPAHTYADTGSFTVKLIIRNSNGCMDSVTRTNYINIQKPFVNFDNLPDSGCVSFRKKITVTNSSADSIVGYRWSFGEGQGSTAASPEHLFTAAGYYPVSLIATGVSGCKDTTVLENAIHVGNRPVAAFSANTQVACAQAGIVFTDLSTGHPSQWQWDFGDNSQAVEQNPRHVFTDTGFLWVRLIAAEGGCADTLTRNNYVYIKPTVSKFKYEFTCAAPFTFIFNNYSIGADNWQWDFGDGSLSSELNPVHTYSDTGVYSVSLKGANNTTGCEFLLTKKLKATKIYPSFFASDSIACKGKDLRFTATISAAEASRFIWDFGDGHSDNLLENTVTHVYEQPGIYTVTLITINLVNCRDTVVKTGYIRVNGLKAGFGADAAAACANSRVLFYDSSFTVGNNSIQNWQWDFGDGNIENFAGAPFSHAYTNGGSFPVKLKITDNNGCTDQFTQDLPITIKKVSALFIAYDTLKCSNSSTRFVAPYAEAGISYQWDFGDGTGASVQSPSHVYTTEGDYTVTLKISHVAGCADSMVRPAYIRIEDPVAAFTMSDSFRSCPPLSVQFSSQSRNVLEETWDFGDGTITATHNPSHFYAEAGIYNVVLTIKGRGGCSSTLQRRIVVKGPKGALSYTPLNFCNPGLATFTAHTSDAASYVWDFNDGFTVTNTDSVVTHYYGNNGKYLPKLMLADQYGCKVPINGIDTINMVHVDAQFEFANRILCAADHIEFDNTSTSSEPVAVTQWNFGDGFYASNANQPTHDYQAAGLYYPSLIITTESGCTDSLTSTVPVKVVNVPAAVIHAGTSGCAPLTASFTASANTSAAPIVNWHWDFDNGQFSSSQLPISQQYNTPGIYSVALTITSDEGCSKTIVQDIEAFPVPAVQVSGVSQVCRGAGTLLTATGADTYSWSTGTGVVCSTCASTYVYPVTDEIYTVTGKNSFGCQSVDTFSVAVAQPIQLGYAGSARICAGKSAGLSATGAAHYTWSPATGLNDAFSSTPQATPAVTTVYTVIGYDATGCFTDTGLVTIIVDKLPTVDAGPDKTITAGSSTVLDPVVSGDVTELHWSPTAALFRNSGNAVTVKPTVNTAYRIEVKNAAGCTAGDDVTITVTAPLTQGSVFIPNTFSPNGDGVNEIFYPRAARNIQVNRLRILNREGQTVFEKNHFYTNDISSGWDGTSRGLKMPADIYIYAVELLDDNGKPYLISGNVSLLR